MVFAVTAAAVVVSQGAATSVVLVVASDAHELAAAAAAHALGVRADHVAELSLPLLPADARGIVVALRFARPELDFSEADAAAHDLRRLLAHGSPVAGIYNTSTISPGRMFGLRSVELPFEQLPIVWVTLRELPP